MIYVFYLVIFICFIAPFSLLFHEVGHVVGARIMKATSIRLTIGIGKRLWNLQLENVQIIVHRFFLINSLTSTVRDEPFRRTEKIMITMMGPIFSGLLATVFYLLYLLLESNYMMQISFLFNIWLVIINIIPFKIGQKH